MPIKGDRHGTGTCFWLLSGGHMAEHLYGLFCQQGAPRTGKDSSSSEAL
jgi:hypothetical protein